MYLLLDGIDDWLKTPVITADRVVIDMSPNQTRTGYQMYVEFKDNVSLGSSDDGTDFVNGSIVYYKVDGVDKIASATKVPNNTRCVVDVKFASATSSSGYIFANQLAAIPLKGKIYNLKFYNGATLVLHYDMNTGTVNDQTGNGNTGILTGGTWMGVPFSDNFNRVDSALTLGPLWEIEFPGSRTWGVSSNKAYVVSNNDGRAVVDVDTADCVVQATMSINAIDSGVIFRYESSTEYHQMVATSTGYELSRFNLDEGPVSLGTYTATPANGDILTIVLSGNSITVYINDISRITATSSRAAALVATKHGIRAINNTVRIDDFTVTASYSPPSSSSIFPSVNIGGVWKTPTAGYVNIGGTWRQITGSYVNINGTWHPLS